MSEKRCPICEKRLGRFEKHNIGHCAETLGLRVAELRSELRKWQTGAIVGIEFVPMMIDALEKERDALRAENTRLREENARLMTQVEQYAADEAEYLRAVQEPCGDELHCTCVPGLRKLLDEQRARASELEAWQQRAVAVMKSLEFSGMTMGRWECPVCGTEKDAVRNHHPDCELADLLKEAD